MVQYEGEGEDELIARIGWGRQTYWMGENPVWKV